MKASTNDLIDLETSSLILNYHPPDVPTNLCGLSGLLGLGSTWLRLWGLLNRALGLADGGGSGNSGGTEIWSVAILGDIGGDTCVGLTG